MKTLLHTLVTAIIFVGSCYAQNERGTRIFDAQKIISLTNASDAQKEKLHNILIQRKKDFTLLGGPESDDIFYAAFKNLFSPNQQNAFFDFQVDTLAVALDAKNDLDNLLGRADFPKLFHNILYEVLYSLNYDLDKTAKMFAAYSDNGLTKVDNQLNKIKNWKIATKNTLSYKTNSYYINNVIAECEGVSDRHIQSYRSYYFHKELLKSNPDFESIILSENIDFSTNNLLMELGEIFSRCSIKRMIEKSSKLNNYSTETKQKLLDENIAPLLEKWKADIIAGNELKIKISPEHTKKIYASAKKNEVTLNKGKVVMELKNRAKELKFSKSKTTALVNLVLERDKKIADVKNNTTPTNLDEQLFGETNYQKISRIKKNFIEAITKVLTINDFVGMFGENYKTHAKAQTSPTISAIEEHYELDHKQLKEIRKLIYSHFVYMAAADDYYAYDKTLLKQRKRRATYQFEKKYVDLLKSFDVDPSVIKDKSGNSFQWD